MALDTEIRFRSAAERAAFTDDLAAAVTSLVSRYHDDHAPRRRSHAPVHRAGGRGAGNPRAGLGGDRHRPGHHRLVAPHRGRGARGGKYAFDMGSGLNESGVVSGWDPPRRFATEGVRWQPVRGGPAARLATEWVVEARGDGTCVVRMVMSGFGTGAAWDDEIDGMTEGMRQALDSLRSHLERATTSGTSPRPRRSS